MKRNRKFNNQPVELDGFRFDSKKEAKRWSELAMLEALGVIRDLQRQVRFPIVVKGVEVCAYVADFVYVLAADARQVIEDVKSDHTRKLPVYRLKKKLLFALYGIDIREV